MLKIFKSLCFVIACGVIFNSNVLWAKIIPSFKFKDADIKLVLNILSQEANKEENVVNIVVSPKVIGMVTVDFKDITWETALKAIVSAYNYAYRWIDESVILVAPIEEIKEREIQEKERQQSELTQTKVFHLKYIDASDAKTAVEPLLSALGKISVLELTGQAGWEFGTDVAKRERKEGFKMSRTKNLLVSDVISKISEIEKLLDQIDVQPKQILIKIKIMEVSSDYLKDIGFDWATGPTGAESSALNFVNGSKFGGHLLGDQVTPSTFGPATAAITTANTGLKLAYKKLSGTEFEAIVHALEEDGNTNVLSSPSILTLNNQEASILVGEKYPIVKTDTSTETNQIVGGSLDYYQDIGIQLNVIPQIVGEDNNFINMIIHPAVTSRLQDVTIRDQSGNTLVSYPWLTSRETETQVMVKDGETIIIAGLLKDTEKNQEIGVPFLSNIPILGNLFKRTIKDTEKIDLMIFITAKIINPEDEPLRKI